MRLLRLVPLSALVLFAVSATCVTDVRQKGPEEPWVGEVANTGEQTVIGSASAEIFDAENVFVSGLAVPSCPAVLLPGDRGAFELSAFAPGGPDIEFTSPLRAEFTSQSGVLTPPHGRVLTYRGDGLLAEITETLDAGRVVSVRVTNNFDRVYRDVRLCGVAREADGGIRSVAYLDTQTGRTLARGESITLNLFFAAGAGTNVRVYAEGVDHGPLPPCRVATRESDWRRYDAGAFSVMLPPGWEYDPAQGIDSFIGGFSGDGITLGFDYGWYSNSLPYDDDPAYDVNLESIAGRTAKIVAARGPSGVTGVYLPLVAESQGVVIMPLRLQMSGMHLTPQQQTIALQIFRSLRFAAP